MIALLIVLGCLVAYFGVGAGLARADMPRAWERARAEWSFDDMARESVMAQTVCTTLLWPFIAPVRFMLTVLRSSVDRADPVARERALKERENAMAERERNIASLERELGIGRTP